MLHEGTTLKNSCEHFLRCQTTVSLHPKHKIQLLAPSTKADSKDQQEQNLKKSHIYLKKQTNY